ncbi:phosphatidylinositol alpha-mannosyltransferase [Enemella dayhoffiae]|uniref:Phosphatidylinositol alpha-mannosyltransferase n=1 Tax=Enemella dayhoffiae TaxID=2016507 RepID=A0A255H3F2_9ACTN|nr:glycosyltransferase family 4 protein [Enemella dayhoffiae]OYO21942.1 phosphatidylinositol alpha-mannosyltransferase [Enemella dayhoffiae]
MTDRPLRIGLVCPYSLDVPGGVQQQVLGLAGWLRAAGERVELLAPGHVPAEGLTSLGGTIPVRWNGSTARIAAGPRTALRVRRWLRRGRFDVLHLHEPFTPSAALWALALAPRGTRVIATFHAAVTPATGQARLAQGAGRAAGRLRRRITGATAPSRAAADTATRHWGIQPELIPNGITLPEPRAASTPQQPPRLTFLGRLDEPRKGLSVLLAALPLIRQQLGPVELTLAGPGTAPREAEQPGVRVVGKLSETDKLALLRRTDVFVAPNTGGESFGLVLVEAMGAGAQVVASALPGFLEVLMAEGVRLAETFPAGDPAALTERLRAVLETPVPADRLRAAAARYDWSAVGPRFLAHYLQQS